MVKARRSKGATRKPVRKQAQPIVWLQGLRHLIILTVFIALAASLVWLQKEDTLPILHVSVDGPFKHADKKELVKVVTPYVVGSFISVDVAKLRQAGEALAWVKLIQVKRIWPDTLHLVVEEQQAIAQWSDKALVNIEGKLFFPAKQTFPRGLVTLSGPEGTSEIMTSQYISLLARFAEVGLTVNQLAMDKRRSWLIEFNNGMQLKLGRANNKQRTSRFVNIYKAVLKRYQAQIKTVDMRYTNGLTVVWKSGPQPDFRGTV